MLQEDYANSRYWKLKDEYGVKLTAEDREKVTVAGKQKFLRSKETLRNKIHYFDYVEISKLNSFLFNT
ncbi:MAG: hypothetical protein IPG02_04225 [Ignavibacteria bacterium]|nr:hypothetical protein [Ignavibacteria bacterium]